MLPLQVIDSFLLNYNIGQVLLFAFILTTLGALPLKSQKVLAINTTLFGVVFFLTPQAISEVQYLFLAIVLVLVGPMLFVTSGR